MRRPQAVLGVIAMLMVVTMVSGCMADFNSTTGTSGARYVIKYTSPDPVSEPQADQINHFADLVEKDSHGQIAVKPYFDGVLATSAGGVNLVSSGAAQMTYANPPGIAAYEPDYNFLQEPLLFTDQAKINRGLTSPVIKSLDEKFRQKTGMRILAWGALGFIDLLNSKHPITTAADMRGLRFRVIPGSAPVTSAMNALGAQPVPLDITEVYTALEQSTIDGNVDPSTTSYPSKEWEIAKYLTVMPFQYNPMPILINDKFFQSLPPDLQQVVSRDAQATATWEIAEQAREAQADVQLMAQGGVHVTTPSAAQQATFVQALAPERKRAYQQFGPALFAAFDIPVPS